MNQDECEFARGSIRVSPHLERQSGASMMEAKIRQHVPQIPLELDVHPLFSLWAPRP